MSEWLRAGDPRLAPTTDLAVVRETIARFPDGTARDEMLAFLDARPDALLRSCEPGHLTGSALVVDAGGERVLLHRHRKLGMWLQFGGHCDGDANLGGVALREAREESGIDGLAVWAEPANLDVHEVRAPGEPVHLHLDVQFLARAPDGAVPRISPESTDLRWFAWDELAPLGLDGALRRLIRAATRRAWK